jgi:hypothetical protein
VSFSVSSEEGFSQLRLAPNTWKLLGVLNLLLEINIHFPNSLRIIRKESQKEAFLWQWSSANQSGLNMDPSDSLFYRIKEAGEGGDIL